MQLGPNDSAVKPSRERLPNKRRCETTSFEHEGSQFQMTVGFYPDGRPGEVFLNHDRGDSALDTVASDAAIAVSIALQFGADVASICAAMKRNSRGEPSSPIGAALDLVTP